MHSSVCAAPCRTRLLVTCRHGAQRTRAQHTHSQALTHNHTGHARTHRGHIREVCAHIRRTHACNRHRVRVPYASACRASRASAAAACAPALAARQHWRHDVCSTSQYAATTLQRRCNDAATRCRRGSAPGERGSYGRTGAPDQTKHRSRPQSTGKESVRIR
jgi:hypothetical protein